MTIVLNDGVIRRPYTVSPSTTARTGVVTMADVTPIVFVVTALQRESELQVLRSCYASLTPREKEVMALVVSGLLNKQVGGELGISLA